MEPSPVDPRTGPGPCVINDKGVPACGVLWGIAAQEPTAEGVRSVEQAVGRQFDVVYRYHDLNDQVPDEAERRLVAGGRLLHIAIAARDFSEPDRSSIGWAKVAAGEYDDSLRQQARGVASLHKPVYVTFEQEASQQRKLDDLGAPADFVAAWRRVRHIYESAGANNAVWVWVMTGSVENLYNAAALWPGNDEVDWISWNVYNRSGCKTNRISASRHASFDYQASVFYRFLMERGPSFGIDVTKPMMISETGSVTYPGDSARTGEWYKDIPTALKKYPEIKAVTLWDNADLETPDCDYRFSLNPAVTAAVKQAGDLPLVRPRNRVASD